MANQGDGYGNLSTGQLIASGLDPLLSSAPGFGGAGLFGNESSQFGGGGQGLGSISDYLNQGSASNPVGGFGIDVGSGVYNTTGVTGGAGIPSASGATLAGLRLPSTGGGLFGGGSPSAALGRVYGNDPQPAPQTWRYGLQPRQVTPLPNPHKPKVPDVDPQIRQDLNVNPPPVVQPISTRVSGSTNVGNVSDYMNQKGPKDDKSKKSKTIPVNIPNLNMNELKSLLQLLTGSNSSAKPSKASGGIPNPQKIPHGGTPGPFPTNQNFPPAPVGNNQLYDPNPLKAYYAQNTPGSGFTSPFAGMGILNPQTNMQTTIDQPTGGMPSYLTPSPTFNATYASGPQQLVGNQPPLLNGGAMQQGYGVSNPQGIQNGANPAMQAAQAPNVSPQVMQLLKSLGLG